MDIIEFHEYRIRPESQNMSDESYENIVSSMNAQGISCNVVYR
jgi:hypothetical protein